MKGLIFINLGTPESPTVPAVRHYLNEFLSDPDVIDTPAIVRWLLVHTIILPFRPKRSAHQYQQIWTKNGSPLLYHTNTLAEAVQKQLGPATSVAVGMRYGHPSIAEAVETVLKKGVEEILFFPLFPQYSKATTGSIEKEIHKLSLKIPPTPLCQRGARGDLFKIVPPFFQEDGFLQSFAEIGRPVIERNYPAHILFSFHGLPEKQIQKGDPYRDQCLKTARGLALKLDLQEKDYTICFQSRMGRARWIRPYTDQEIIRLVKEGKRRLIVFAPSFVTDCLETLEEIGIRYRGLALAHGAESFELVPSLNSNPQWVNMICQILRSA